MIVAETCSPVDRMYVTAMPGEQHEPWLKITSTGRSLGCNCKQNVGMSRRNYHKHDQAPLSLYKRSTIA